MRPILFVLPLLVIAGCCGMSSTPSSFCPLGTYGSACTDFCDRSAGTQYDGGPNCFSECMALVRQAEMGDATTCCKESISEACQRTCTETMASIYSKYGAGAMGEEQREEIEQCVGECTAPYLQMGIPLNSCNVLDYDIVKQAIAED
ncbi:MAG: hypothetical protein PHV13_01015 [Candidatus ainarchaeum sp.]|nr:hypothetical protein [Candidatus ainarchaeum sp.]